MEEIIIAASLFVVFLPFLVLVTILVNRVVGDYRERQRQGREMDPADRDFWRLCIVFAMVALWLGGW